MPSHQTCVQFLKTISTSVLLMGYGEGHTGTKAKQTTNLPRSASSLLSRSYRSPTPRQADSRTLTRQQLLVGKLPAPEDTPRLSSFLHTRAGGQRQEYQALSHAARPVPHPSTLATKPKFKGRQETHAARSKHFPELYSWPTSNYRGVCCSEHRLPARATETLMI